jgi:hypothetical protein
MVGTFQLTQAGRSIRGHRPFGLGQTGQGALIMPGDHERLYRFNGLERIGRGP